MTRGRLIFPFLAELRLLDVVATDASASPLTSGYDDDFAEPVVLVSGATVRREKPPLQLQCQVATEDGAFDDLSMQGGGNSPSRLVTLTFHFSELEDLGLVDMLGRAALRVNDRLAKILDLNGNLVQSFEDVPMYATMVQPRSFGLTSLRRNLLDVRFEERQTSLRDVR